MEFPQVPAGNGLVDLTEEQTLLVQGKLQTIVSEFVPTFDEPNITTQYIVGEYIKRHEKDADFIRINGDTAQHVLAFSTETTPDTTSEGTTSDHTKTGEV
jgi:hypothetical protein